MDRFIEIIQINFCKVCKNKCNNCLDLKVIESDYITSYKCANYYNDAPLEEYKKYIKFDYRDDNNNVIAVIREGTPPTAIIELRKHYDYVKSKI